MEAGESEEAGEVVATGEDLDGFEGDVPGAEDADGRDADDWEASRESGFRPPLPTEGPGAGGRPKGRAKLSVSQKAPEPKAPASNGGKSASRTPRKSSGKGGGPAYGRKNTKKKGNGRGGRR